ncbi:MAG: sodium ion-translocating decarboxylase subunit beta [Treponemataceae bacterium]|nr:sodium ion-translocating decarboxylase subunit beta [Treponemataceae bacterium]
MKNLLSDKAIEIIGGADGPTTIYVSSGAKVQFIIFISIFVILFCAGFVLALTNFIKNLKNKAKLKCMIYGAISLLFFMFGAMVAANFISIKMQQKQIEKALNQYNYLEKPEEITE